MKTTKEQDQAYAEEIVSLYTEHEPTRLEKLRKLDKKVKMPPRAIAYCIGVFSTLVLGVGMCLAMKVIGNLMPLGIVAGVVGIGIMIANYYIYRAILKARKAKYANQVLALSEEMLNL